MKYYLVICFSKNLIKIIVAAVLTSFLEIKGSNPHSHTPNNKIGKEKKR